MNKRKENTAQLEKKVGFWQDRLKKSNKPHQKQLIARHLKDDVARLKKLTSV
jgi:hypothetical protein